MVSYVNILGLPAATGFTGTENFPLVQAGTDKKATINQLLAFVQTTGGLTVGSEVITGGLAGQLLYDAGGILGETSHIYIAPSTLQLGGADSGAPVAQTLSVQNVVTGTSNAAGVNWTFKASAGTGTGAGGNFIFQTAPAGGSGTTQNTFSTAFTLDNSLGGHAVTLLSTVGQTQLNTTDNLLSFGASNGLNINNTTGGYAINIDTFLTRAGAAAWRLGQNDSGAPVAQTLQVQSVVAGTSNAAGALFTIKGSASTGTGVGGDILFQASATGGSSGTSQNAFFNIMRISPTLGAGASLTLIDQNTGAFKIILNSNNVGMGASGVMQAAFLENSAQIGFALGGDQLLGWTSANAGATVIGGMDTMMGRSAAAAIRFGQADAAAPVAQTLSVQNVVAGTSNTAGVDWTFNASRGTGTGAGGRFIWQLAAAGGSGTSQNPLANLLMLDSTGLLTLANGSGQIFAVSNNLSLGASGLFSGMVAENITGQLGFRVTADRCIGWSANSTSSNPNVGQADTFLTRLSQACAKFNGAWGSSAPNTQSGTTYSMVAGDSSLIFSNAGAVTLTLLSAASNSGRWLYVKNTGAGTLASASSNVVPIGSATAGTAMLAAGPGKWAILESDGTNWITMAAN